MESSRQETAKYHKFTTVHYFGALQSSPNCGRGDPRLTPEAGRHRVLHEDKIDGLSQPATGVNNNSVKLPFDGGGF